MKVLLFAYYFPPDGGAGTQRPTSFARYLPEHGATCTVVTRSPPTARNYYEPADAGLLAKITERCRVERTEPAATTIATWLPHALQLGDALIRAERPDVLLATMSPFELWTVVAELGARHRVPVVFDLRDPWALDGVQSHRSYWHWRRERDEMRRMLQRGDGIVANTPESRRLFLALEPSLGSERVTTITNGWDRDDFPEPHPRVPVPAGPEPAMRVVFTGSFLCKTLYEQRGWRRRLAGLVRYSPEPIQPSGRTPIHLLGAMRRLRERGSPAGRATRFISVGQTDQWLERCVRESGVSEQVELTGYQPHDVTVRAGREADALFLTLHGLPPGHRSRIVPGKAYEYLATGRPILGALPQGDARELVESSGRGFCADACNEELLASALETLYDRWRSGEYVESAPAAMVARFERSRLAGDLAAFLRQVARPSA